MKKLSWISAILLLFALVSTTNAQKIISVGAGVLYNDYSEDFGINGHVIFHALPVLDIKGGYNYYFYDTKDGTYSSFDLDAHYVLIDVMLTRAYVLAGLNFATINWDTPLETDISESNTGINLGAGGEIGLGGALRVFAEAKYITGDYDGIFFSAGVRIGI